MLFAHQKKAIHELIKHRKCLINIRMPENLNMN